jgi:molybdopterin converting factor small subunit
MTLNDVAQFSRLPASRRGESAFDDLYQSMRRGKAHGPIKEARMQVNFFGRLAERIDRSVTIDVPEQTRSVGDLRALLAEQFPHASGDLLKPSLRACVGDELVDDGYPLGGADTVEFFPPVSGG